MKSEKEEGKLTRSKYKERIKQGVKTEEAKCRIKNAIKRLESFKTKGLEVWSSDS